MLDELGRALLNLERERVLEGVQQGLASGAAPLTLLEACRGGMTAVGERFKQGDYYLSELLISAEIFKEAAALIEPRLTPGADVAPRGRVVLATLKGDIHDLGKNILGTLLKAQGFEVHDLGVDVEPAFLVERVVALRPRFVGFSALITVAFASMRAAAEGLVDAGVRGDVRLLLGGGVTTPELREWVGADFQTLDAAEGVAWCLAQAAAA